MEKSLREKMKNSLRRFNRRSFMKRSAIAGTGALIASSSLASPMILTLPRVRRSNEQGKLTFRPYFVHSGVGPHLLDWAYASDSTWDAFHSNISSTREGVLLSDTEGVTQFGIDVRWNVEGFGYIYITADNGGEFYRLPVFGKEQTLNLNFELAKSRVLRNRKRISAFMKQGWNPSREVKTFLDLSNELFEAAQRIRADEFQRAELSQKSLFYAMWGSEMMELDKARFDIAREGYRPHFFFGCDARAFYQMYQDRFLELFPELFNYAMITFVTKGDGIMSDFEPEEGRLNFDTRDVLIRKLKERGVTPQGRALFWFYRGKTDWLKKKSYDELRKYVEQHTRETVSHYPEGMYGWEIFNEAHDWAMEVNVNPDQMVDLVKLACDVAKDAHPHVQRIINHCCPFAEYVQLKKTSGGDAKYRQRTPWEFTRALIEAGVDFNMLGQQMYFPYRDLQDIVMMLERYETFQKPLQLSEVGASGGPTNNSVKLGAVSFSDEPPAWHRHWDEELQADWLEGVYTLAYSKPWIQNCSWFDFLDQKAFQRNGGLLRLDSGEKKAAWHRLKSLQDRWKNFPKSKG